MDRSIPKSEALRRKVIWLSLRTVAIFFFPLLPNGLKRWCGLSTVFFQDGAKSQYQHYCLHSFSSGCAGREIDLRHFFFFPIGITATFEESLFFYRSS